MVINLTPVSKIDISHSKPCCSSTGKSAFFNGIIKSPAWNIVMALEITSLKEKQSYVLFVTNCLEHISQHHISEVIYWYIKINNVTGWRSNSKQFFICKLNCFSNKWQFRMKTRSWKTRLLFWGTKHTAFYRDQLDWLNNMPFWKTNWTVL